MRRSRVGYRIKQFYHAVKQMFAPVDSDYVQRRLSPRLWELFQKLPQREQNHGIAICRNVEKAGYHDADLLTAALLHDVGRMRTRCTLMERVLVVLVERISPHTAEHWGCRESRGWRRGFAVHRLHPEWGADLAAAAGATPGAVTLIRRHHTSPGDGRNDILLRALQQADEG